MSEQGWRGFLAAEGVDDWVVLHGGATAVFRVGSLSQAAHLAEVATRLDVPYLDLAPQVRAREAAGEHLYWDYDHHLRPAGYAFVADALYNWAAATPAK